MNMNVRLDRKQEYISVYESKLYFSTAIKLKKDFLLTEADDAFDEIEKVFLKNIKKDCKKEKAKNKCYRTGILFSNEPSNYNYLISRSAIISGFNEETARAYFMYYYDSAINEAIMNEANYICGLWYEFSKLDGIIL